MAVDSIRFVSLFLQGTEKAKEVGWQPPTDIYRTPEGWLVKMELAGVGPDDVSLSLRGRTLVVRGRRRDCCMAEVCQQMHMEIAYSRFERSIQLPSELSRVSVQTTFRDGMLLIRLDREASA